MPYMRKGNKMKKQAERKEPIPMKIKEVRKAKVRCRCGGTMKHCKRGTWKYWFLCNKCGDGIREESIAAKIRDAMKPQCPTCKKWKEELADMIRMKDAAVIQADTFKTAWKELKAELAKADVQVMKVKTK